MDIYQGYFNLNVCMEQGVEVYGLNIFHSLISSHSSSVSFSYMWAYGIYSLHNCYVLTESSPDQILLAHFFPIIFLNLNLIFPTNKVWSFLQFASGLHFSNFCSLLCDLFDSVVFIRWFPHSCQNGHGRKKNDVATFFQQGIGFSSPIFI